MPFERLALALGLILVGYLAYRLYGWFVLRRLARAGLTLDGYTLGKPAILYFTDPGCAPCQTVQDPALEEVASQYGERVQIIKVQALEDPHFTDSWGVLSLPTTFIIDAKGRPRGVNHGVARAPRLVDQLAAIGETPPLQGEPGTIDSLT
ncbi:MAG: thioredoxin family protein [Chloroflexi bacterium]|nr:thioredoxin family protein [Chloroflexota bacterium]